MDSLKVLELSRSERKELKSLITDYSLLAGNIIWKEEDMPKLQRLVKAILYITDKDISLMDTPMELYNTVNSRVKKLSQQNIIDICFVITYTKEDK